MISSFSRDLFQLLSLPFRNFRVSNVRIRQFALHSAWKISDSSEFPPNESCSVV